MDIKVLVAGMGNILMMDDGIGVYLSKHLKKFKIQGIKSQYLGFQNLKLLDEGLRARYIVFVDAVDMKSQPGQCAVWEGVDLFQTNGITSHSEEFINWLLFLRVLKKIPGKVFLFGVQPAKIDWGIGLSDILENQFYSIAEKLKVFVESLVKGEKYALH